MLVSASPTPYDLRFMLFGFPVRVHPAFWIIALLLGGDSRPEVALVWVGAVFLSILVHELGHALVQRAYRGRPEIVLYALGGVAAAPGVEENWWKNILIALAGPFAGFALAGLVYGLKEAFGMPAAPLGQYFVSYLIGINLIWGVINLVPIWPLDGGHVARELLVRFLPAYKGIYASLWLSIVCAAGAAAFLFVQTGSLFNLMIFGLLGYQNYQALVAYRASRGGW